MTLDALRKAGLNVELQASDWGTLITRRTSKEPVEKGGWSIFHTWTSAPDFFSPAVNLPLRGNGEKAWFGWPTDPKIEELIDAWFKAPDLAAQKKLAADIQVEAYTNDVPYVPTGQFVDRRPPTARTSTGSSSRRSSSCGTSRRNDEPSVIVAPAKAGAHGLGYAGVCGPGFPPLRGNDQVGEFSQCSPTSSGASWRPSR